MKFIVGKKIEMTQIYREDGAIIPVTAVLAMPNVITQVKSETSKDGYNAIQVGFGVAKKTGKALSGHLKGITSVKTVKEFKVKKEDTELLKRGDIITVSVFVEGDEVKVSGISKGKGFQGVVKRHGFHGSPKTHGHKDQLRMPGSIGAGGVQRVFKGKKMAGQMGNNQVTVSGLKIISIDEINNILYIKGAVPGSRNGLVYIFGNGIIELKQPLTSAEIDANTSIEEKKDEVVMTETVETIETLDVKNSNEKVKSE